MIAACSRSLQAKPAIAPLAVQLAVWTRLDDVEVYDQPPKGIPPSSQRLVVAQVFSRRANDVDLSEP